MSSVFWNMIGQLIRHPRQSLHYMKPSKIIRVLYYLRHDGLNGVSRILDERLLMGADLKLNLRVTKDIQANDIAAYPPIVLPKTEAPIVSIIIPVYNQFAYTYSCLRAIAKHSEEITYEVILADDCSTDLTLQIEKIVKNIRIVRSNKNLRFLKNCNHSAQFARGKYYLFLNNDTQVQPGWLAPMVQLMEENPDIGLTGSRLVYSDGRLQEAGGILWRDGSAWNYGHGNNPALPEYNYVKDVDYISGASIMVRSELWKQLGGFDERFAPAYYEDSDLAFSIRKAGYRVVYQPLSVVVHFEGVSNGTDVSTGLKAYQMENQKKFYEKWKEVLEKEHLPNGQDPFLTRDRSQMKKRILVIDHRVPWYDKDAGARNVFMYTQIFSQLGLKVTFMPDDYFPQQPYTRELEQSGIEVLYGNYYFKYCKYWLKENVRYYDYIYVNRPHIAVKYMDLLKKYAKGKIIYFGHDLHYLREYRQYEVSHDEAYLESSKKWKNIEFELIRKADVVYVVGNYEYKVLKKEFPEKPLRNIPIFTYEALDENNAPDLEGRKNLLFVGGFGHPPNIDAVLWFAKDIFPRIQKVYPDIIWNIVGANPTDEIKSIANDHIHLLGFVSDERLKEIYSECRLVVVPLRYGAGVKGKVVESVYNQSPMITTQIGAEGLSLEEGAFAVAEADASFADKVISLYGDDDALLRLMSCSRSFINNHFTINRALEVVLKDIQP
ncbi:glycosyltransferase [Lacrimispora xylanolytica]|uniref:Glycosyltransferase n=1 Tax=Lacrimispora xylanolytica TaxID=29375 RepID=A0ABY7AGA3_9FIRM|nr:glycosyltransferase [Lacrimispora xylanolytica]WAJ24552.1 glycosyltransferase [Lacrimispora xylanolytica]